MVKLETAAKLQDEGKSVAEICREIVVSEATLARWRRVYGSMNRTEARELRVLCSCQCREAIYV